jgi:hypothetical protein
MDEPLHSVTNFTQFTLCGKWITHTLASSIAFRVTVYITAYSKPGFAEEDTMNSAFTHHHAGRKAARLAWRAALACALVMGGGAALAQQHGDRRDDPNPPSQGQGQAQPQQRPERFHLPPQGRDGRDGRDAREPRQAESRGYEEVRRMPPEQSDAQRRPPSRMTADERRDLRRQINEAGMDLYPQRQH